MVEALRNDLRVDAYIVARRKVRRMQWGVHLPHLGRQATRDALISFSQQVEAAGFNDGWVSDHVAWPRSIESKYPYTDDGSFPAGNDMPWLDPIGTLFFVAACTERLRLGTTVLILPYRPPMLTAKAIASLDSLSGGRVIFGVGVGWMREEAEALGMPFDHRGARSDEQLELIQAMFTQESPSYDGRFYTVPAVGFSPKPVRGTVPIWVGGDTEPALRRVVRFGDAFHAAFQPIDDVAAAWKRIGELCAEAGRDRDRELTLSIRLYHDPDSNQAPAKSIAGTSQQMLDTVRRWQDIGVEHILLDPVGRGGPGRRAEELTRFMDEVGTPAAT